MLFLVRLKYYRALFCLFIDEMLDGTSVYEYVSGKFKPVSAIIYAILYTLVLKAKWNYRKFIVYGIYV